MKITSTIKTRNHNPIAPPAQDRKDKKWCYVFGILLFILVAWVFLPVVGNDFVQWDDDMLIYQNPHITSIDLAHLKWMFTDVGYSLRYRPLTWLGFAIIYQIAGFNPFYYHLAGLFLHCANVVLVYFFLQRLFFVLKFERVKKNAKLTDLLLALCSLMWGLNPLRVEPVARATDLAYDESLFLMLISLLFYLRDAGRTSSADRRWYWGSVVAFALAMLCYPTIFGFAVVLAVFDVYHYKRSGFASRLWWQDSEIKKVLIEKVPFFAAAGIFVFSLYGIEHPTGIWESNNAVDPEFTIFSRLMQSFYSLAYYTWKPWLPFDLSPVYTTLVSFNPYARGFVVSAITVSVLTGLLYWKRGSWPLPFSLWVCHLVLLVPALGLTQHPHYLSDRYGHVDGILWAVWIAVAGVTWLNQAKAGCARYVLLVGLTLLVGTWGTLSYKQTQIWRDSPTLFNYMIVKLKKDPYRSDIYQRLGKYYIFHDHVDDAIPALKSAIDIEPRLASSRVLLGIAFLNKNDPDQAMDQFKEAAKYQPNNLDAHNGYAVALQRKGRDMEAMAEFNIALGIDPTNRDAKEGITRLLEQSSRQR